MKSSAIAPKAVPVSTESAPRPALTVASTNVPLPKLRSSRSASAGWLDLYVGNYHRFHRANRKRCFLTSGQPDYCGPLSQPSAS